MREIRTSGSMSGDGKRDQYACGVQSTRARPRLYPRGRKRAACCGIKHLWRKGYRHGRQAALRLQSVAHPASGLPSTFAAR